VFFGATALGHACCRALLDRGVQIAGIVTIPSTFSISYAKGGVKNVTHQSFDDLARKHKLPTLSVDSGMGGPELERVIASWKPDLAIVVGWYYMIPRRIRELFPLGVAGVHASLLPKYRGGAPLVWSIINGESSTGVSLFYFDDGVDTGDLVAQSKIRIGHDDTIATVYKRASAASVRLVSRYVPLMLNGNAPRQPQDHSLATVFPQRAPKDGLIDWTQSPEQIRNFIRAQTKPYPGAFTYIDGKKVTVWSADIVQEDEAAPGSPRV
jgi:methionyl-tRNA formyltransferase